MKAIYTVICYPRKEGENSIEVEVIATSYDEAKQIAEKLSKSSESYVKSIKQI